MIRTSIAGSLFAILLASGVTTAQAPPASIQPGTVFKTSSELVVLDVVATDPHRDPIHHLAASDFTILEDGKPQTIKVFEEHAAGVTPQNASMPAPAPMPKLQPGRFTNFTPAPASGAANILLLDMLNTPLQAQSFIRSEALNFLKEMRPGTEMAIFTLSSNLALVQGFTSDASLLRVQLESKKGSQTPSHLLVDPMSGERPGVPDDLSGGGGDDVALAMVGHGDPAKQMAAETRSELIRLRARITLEAMSQLARYLSNIPGRKNLNWFSSSFPIHILPDPSAAPIDPFQIDVSTEDELKETADIMARSRVAVYPVRPGLVTPPWFDADNAKPGSPDAVRQFTEKNAGETATMNQIAKATGGKAFVNTNGLKEAVEEAIQDGSNYYTLAYTPTDHTGKGDYRKIEVKLDKPKAALDYRRGYYAEDASEPAQQVKQVPGASPVSAPYSALRTAMLHGSPQPTQIILVADVRPSVPGTEPAAASGNQPTNGISGPFRRYTVTFLTTPGELHCNASPDGLHHCAMEFLTVVFDANGARVNMQTNALSLDVPPDRFAWLQTQSFNYRQQISVPAKGEYFLRMGMRDVTNDRVGAVEMPVADIANLPAVSGESSSQAAASPVK